MFFTLIPFRKHMRAFMPSVALTICLLVAPNVNAQQSTKNDTSGAKSASKNSAGVKPPAKSTNANKPPAPKALSAPLPAQLAYQFTLGTTYRYRLSALFDGHIPPFAQPDSPPIHIKVDLVYVATVKKVDKTGATVEFSVDSADLSLFDHEIREDEKIDPDKTTPFPHSTGRHAEGAQRDRCSPPGRFRCQHSDGEQRESAD